jgi:hypothetical protein
MGRWLKMCEPQPLATLRESTAFTGKTLPFTFTLLQDIGLCFILCTRSRDSSVGIATGYGLDEGDGGSSIPDRVKHSNFSISSRPALGSTQPPINWVRGLKRQGRETDHLPPTSAEVKKMWIHTYTPPYIFMA